MKKSLILLLLSIYGFIGYSQTSIYDVNGDGFVTAADVTSIYEYILGYIGDEVVYEINGVKFNMKEVLGGTFIMGATEEQGNGLNEEYPVHQVTLNTYFIGTTEVTQELWLAVMGNNPSYYNGGIYGNNLKRPVERVSWNECIEFITKLNQMTGKNFRLPTEAEWEYAARGGKMSMGYRFAGSNSPYQVAWFFDNLPSQTYNTAGCCPQGVATLKPNELGIYDMSGNVYEWCNDWFGNYSEDAQTNPIGPDSGTSHVARGGSWQVGEFYSRVSCRVSSINGHDGLGFRLAL